MKIINPKKLKEHFNVAVVVSRFNEDITRLLLEGALQRLKELDFADEHITVMHVPGAVELPLAAQRLAHTEHYEVVICLGAVIRGETDHYDHVCQQVSLGCQQVALQFDIPIIFGVLTTNDEAQAFDRAGGKHGHKGRDAVDAALDMVSVIRQIH